MRGIVCGLGQVGYRVSLLALQAGHHVTIVTSAVRPEWQRILSAAGAIFVHGDARDEHLLVAAGLAEAVWIVAATANDLTNIEIVLDAKRLNHNVRTVARVFDQNLAPRLEATFGIDRVLAMSSLAAPAFVSAAFGEQLVVGFNWATDRYGVLRVRIGEGHPFVGKTLEEVERETGMPPLLHVDGAGVAVLLPSFDRNGADIDGQTRRLEVGDTLKLVGSESAMQALGSLPTPSTRRSNKEARHPRRRPWRHLWRNAPRDLRLLLLGLLTLIMLSTFVFKFGMSLSPIDAFYFVVTTVTTTGYGDISPKDFSPWLKLFTCLVMLLGSAAVATLYSIITDALVSARIQELTGGPPIPDDGHVIVVGLGNVGFRTCEELLRLGIRPVGIDLSTDAKLVSTLRAQMAVVRGDAREPEVLAQANLATASAIIVATSDDSVNLSIGLLVREEPGDHRIVLRIFDDRFAGKVQSTVAFNAVFSASGLAAPTFVGSALFPSSVASFVIRGMLLTLFVRKPEELPAAAARGEGVVMRRPDGSALTAISQVLHALPDV